MDAPSTYTLYHTPLSTMCAPTGHKMPRMGPSLSRRDATRISSIFCSMNPYETAMTKGWTVQTTRRLNLKLLLAHIAEKGASQRNDGTRSHLSAFALVLILRNIIAYFSNNLIHPEGLTRGVGGPPQSREAYEA